MTQNSEIKQPFVSPAKVQTKKRRGKGFTLPEAIGVIILISVLIGVAFAVITNLQKSASASTTLQNVEALLTAKAQASGANVAATTWNAATTTVAGVIGPDGIYKAFPKADASAADVCAQPGRTLQKAIDLGVCSAASTPATGVAFVANDTLTPSTFPPAQLP